MTTRDNAPAAIKLSARHLWKVYGPGADGFFDSTGPRLGAEQSLREMRAHGHMPAVIDVSFDVREGEIFVIMGLSGSGKSTVIRCLSRLVEPTHGEVKLDGEDLLGKSTAELIEIRRHKMGMVFQNFSLLPHLTVFENVAFPLKLQGLGLKDRRRRVEHVIALVGLEGRESSFPDELSGGQQQRVGIARSLAVEPDVWLLDEPFSALDPLIRRQMQDEFLRIQNTLKKSIVFITHDFLEALRIADRMAIMRDGRIVQIGTPRELLLNPADAYVAEFTCDVPRSRLLTAGDFAVAGPAQAASMATVAGETGFDRLVEQLARNPDGLQVNDRHGARLGIITAASMVQTLASFTPVSPHAS
ncbi:glycine betaine/proline transport system ATP-binding protein [Hoeflea marina]|uniref:Quaternary amine transport ATP-binding protein n=1 Tax=Hoeflea marina TaxID=274592 RepID=A0A317PRI1_9HYPH|nr:betaine/proline/choline family ABC transporter ATP-binding protein [Hoeflea marina]PWW03779.1 glycine betaine/proline transport system ATP-binding protein [Hoeflea marina]